jgi:hypothetical protein
MLSKNLSTTHCVLISAPEATELRKFALSFWADVVNRRLDYLQLFMWTVARL